MKLRQLLHLDLLYKPSHQRIIFMDELTLNCMIYLYFDLYYDQ
jgi:hypothetical protein